MAFSTSDCVSLRVFCPHCNQATAQLLSWLIVHSHMPCASCSGVIDLQIGDNGLRIQELAEKCEAIDAALSE